MMVGKNAILIFLGTFLISASLLAQQESVKDSTKIYGKIETYSKGSKFKSFIYHLIFKPVPKEEIVYKKPVQASYRDFQGKIIRKINIITLDPFGYSVFDTTSRSENFVTKGGNWLHIKSRQMTIRNLLLIKEKQPFESYYAKESERLIRSQRFVHDVAFYISPVSPKSDSIDITIREIDIWSITPQFAFTTSQYKTGLTDRNFLGFGDEFQNIFTRNMTTGINAFNTNYYVPSIKSSYIRLRVHYGADGWGNVRGSISLDRPFYSPFEKWAGGVTIASRVARDSLGDINPARIPVNLEYNTQDIWGARAIRIFRGIEEEDQIINLIFSLRYLRIRYHQKPDEVNDPLHIYSNEDFYLGSIGISSRKYIQDRYIFKYGEIEDVPVGKVYEVTGGYQSRNNELRPYFGFRISNGNYFHWGYLSSEVYFGTFFRGPSTEQGVINAGVDYFTGLFEAGNWKFRQFVKSQVTLGIKRAAYDTITLNDQYGISGFSSPTLSGTNRLILSMQTQSYAPWNLAGFNFGPYITGSLGIISDETSGFSDKKIYTQIGIGLLIKNSNLVFNIFQVSLSYYPTIPGRGSDIIKINAFRTTDFGFRDFEINKPAQALYR
jgi:hypothetical protein